MDILLCPALRLVYSAADLISLAVSTAVLSKQANINIVCSPIKAFKMFHLNYRGPANLHSFVVGVRLVLDVTNLEIEM